MSKTNLRICIGTTNGLIKALNIGGTSSSTNNSNNTHSTVATFGVQSRGNVLNAMCSANPDNILDYSRVCLAFNDGTLRYLDLSSGDTDGETFLLSKNVGQHQITNLFLLEKNASKHPTLLFTQTDGSVCTLSIRKALKKRRFNAKRQPKPILSSRGHTSRATLHDSHTLIALGGHKVEAGIWDIEHNQRVWQAKNVAHDFLDMPVPVHVKDLTFIEGRKDRLAIATHFQQVRLYDARSGSQRRPTHEYSFKLGGPLNCITTTNTNTHLVFTGDTMGNIRCLDTRKFDRMFGRYKGPAGSVRSIQCHPTEPLLACVGLDRYLRVFDIQSRQHVHKFYLKQQLHSLLFSTVVDDDTKDNDGGKDNVDGKNNVDGKDIVDSGASSSKDATEINTDDDDDDDDELWKLLSNNQTKKSKRKRHSKESKKSRKRQRS
mmetsp:Transcript_11687/g.17552  ORF Transcript_11687/g.17552 Transcript_11687/m.17552 type:complete len:432 (+) Transcript_11687:1714-3009(+)